MRYVVAGIDKRMPLVGLVTGRFENNGIVTRCRGRAPPVDDVLRSSRQRVSRRCAHAGCATDRGRPVAPSKAELSTDVASEAAGCSHYASFDFDFLRLAVQLRQETVDRRNRRSECPEMIRAFVRSSEITSPRCAEELLDGRNHVLGVRVAQEAGDR